MAKSENRKFLIKLLCPIEQEITINAENFDEANDIGWELADKLRAMLSKLGIVEGGNVEVGEPELDIEVEDDEEEDD